MKQKTLEILDRMTRAGAAKEDRLTELLRDPEADATPGWFMHVPKCFDDALDIKQTTRVISCSSPSPRYILEPRSETKCLSVSVNHLKNGRNSSVNSHEKDIP